MPAYSRDEYLAANVHETMLRASVARPLIEATLPFTHVIVRPRGRCTEETMQAVGKLTFVEGFSDYTCRQLLQGRESHSQRC